MTGFNARELAARVAGLIQGQFNGDLVSAASYLGADAEQLRLLVEGRSSQADLDLLAKIVERFGVDACWLITGEYDWRSHARDLEDDETDGSQKKRLVRLVTGRGPASLSGRMRRASG